MADSDLTVENIIKKYESRQQRLLREKGDSLHTARNREDYNSRSSGASTPQFNNTIERTKGHNSLDFVDAPIERTQKKEALENTYEFRSVGLFGQGEMQNLLARLYQTQEKLARAERNYADAWRKYQKALEGGEGAIIQELQGRLAMLQRQCRNYKESASSKDSNLSLLRQKLKEKVQRVVSLEGTVEELKSQVILLRSRNEMAQSVVLKQKGDLRLQQECLRLQKLVQEKERQRRQFGEQLQRCIRKHREQLQGVKVGFVKAEQQYKEWVQECGRQKIRLIQSYEGKLKECNQIINSNSFRMIEQEKQREERVRHEQQIERLSSSNQRLIDENKQLRLHLQNSERIKLELIHKTSSIENILVEKNESLRSLQSGYQKILEQLHLQEKKTEQANARYSSVSRDFEQLKVKCSVLFSEADQSKNGKKGEKQITQLRKQLSICQELLERARDNQVSMNGKLTDTVGTLRTKLEMLDQEKQEILADLLAERLENAKLKQQLVEAKTTLKKQYDISLENTKRQLQQRIAQMESKRQGAQLSCDVDKETLYLQLRELERRYELLASQIVTVDDMVSIASRLHRRNIIGKK